MFKASCQTSLTFISLTIAWNNPPSAPHSFSTDSTFILSIFSEYRAKKILVLNYFHNIPKRELKAGECLWARAKFQQKSLSVCCPEDWGRWWERRERGGLLSLSPRLRIYSPRLEEVRLVDGPAIVTVIFGQRGGIELNGSEKRRVCVERCVVAPPARQRLVIEWTEQQQQRSAKGPVTRSMRIVLGRTVSLVTWRPEGGEIGHKHTTHRPKRAIRSVQSEYETLKDIFIGLAYIIGYIEAYILLFNLL